jgi:hypothetical protein
MSKAIKELAGAGFAATLAGAVVALVMVAWQVM